MMSSRVNPKQISYFIQDVKKNKENTHNKSSPDYIGSFDDPANGIIFFKQSYEKLFYNQTKLLEFSICFIRIKLFDDNEKRDPLIQLQIGKNKVHLSILWNGTHFQSSFTEILFPKPAEVYDFLEKKIWIYFNRIKRQMKIYTGDITRPEYVTCLFEHSFQTQEERKTKYEIEQRFPKPKNSNDLSGKIEKEENPFDRLKHFEVEVAVQIVHLKENKIEGKYIEREEKIELRDILAVKLINTDRIYDPILVKQASFLQPRTPGIFSVPDQLRMLFNTLKPMDIKQLSPSQRKNPDYENLIEGRWKNLSQAIQHNLTHNYSYYMGNKDAKEKKEEQFIPTGILNHLYLLKNLNMFSNYDTSNKKPEEILEEMIEKRMGYIRMELLPHEGLSPGSMAVLQIWPPYSSSPIHNHGHSYGLIKVLSGQVRVQNFNELTFKDMISQPYMENDYKQGQYTWFSDESYGIHRLLNPYPECAISIQSYYHYRSLMKTVEYFSFLQHDIDFQKEQIYKEKKRKQHKKVIVEKKDSYTEYYPQNDWQNYLSKRMLRKGHEKQDESFINRVIEYYGLEKNNVLDYSFQSFVVTMKKEYDLINEKIKLPKKEK